MLNRRDFLSSGAALAALPIVGGCSGLGGTGRSRMPFGVCCRPEQVDVAASLGFDFFESPVGLVLNPEKDDEWWKRERDVLMALPLPLRSSHGFLPGTFRLTGPKADFGPALDYGLCALRRAEEIGIQTIVFGSGGARNVPGDLTGDWNQRPNAEEGVRQYTDFCRALCRRADEEGVRKTVVVVEPLRPKECNVINYVWQGLQVCEDVNSSHLRLLADLFHMVNGRESPDSILRAGSWLEHCHISGMDRKFLGSSPTDVERFRPYVDALRAIGYAGGISCECAWGGERIFPKEFETSLATLRAL